MSENLVTHKGLQVNNLNDLRNDFVFVDSLYFSLNLSMSAVCVDLGCRCHFSPNNSTGYAFSRDDEMDFLWFRVHCLR